MTIVQLNLLSWSLFQLAVKSVPTKEEFLMHLATSPSDLDQPLYERSLFRDMETYILALEVVLGIINDYYRANQLDMDEQV